MNREQKLIEYLNEKIENGEIPASQLLVPKKFLKITEKDWAIIDQKIENEKKLELTRIDELNEKLFSIILDDDKFL
jgi:hypothetical protein